jgi:hypothetical protein
MHNKQLPCNGDGMMLCNGDGMMLNGLAYLHLSASHRCKACRNLLACCSLT